MNNALLLSIPETARMLGIGRSKTYQLIDEKVLATVTIGRRRLVRSDSVRALAVGKTENACALPDCTD